MAYSQIWALQPQDDWKKLGRGAFDFTYEQVSQYKGGGAAITAKREFKTKPSINGTVSRLKARLVARGFERRQDIDFEETFAPIVKWSTIKP